MLCVPKFVGLSVNFPAGGGLILNYDIFYLIYIYSKKEL